MNTKIADAVETLVRHGDPELLMVGANLKANLAHYIKGVEEHGFMTEDIEDGFALFAKLVTDRVERGQMALEDCYRETVEEELVRCCLLASTFEAA